MLIDNHPIKPFERVGRHKIKILDSVCSPKISRMWSVFALQSIVALLALNNDNVVHSFRLNHRSVEECTKYDFPTTSPAVLDATKTIPLDANDRSEAKLEAKQCHEHCRLTYTESSAEMKDLNGGKLISRIIESRHSDEKRCCCRFDAPWPDTIRMDLWHNEELKAKQAGDYVPFKCAHLLVTFRTKDRARNEYKQMCRYLGKARPLSLLELSRFLQSAAYLNLIRPKHFAFMQALNQKHVRKIETNAAQIWSETLKRPLLDKNRWSLEDYEGFKFEFNELKEIRRMVNEVVKKIKSPVVNRALDEYLMSIAIANVAAAAMKIDKINRDQQIPEELLLGHYDKYNTFNSDLQNEPFRALKQTTNCQLLVSTRMPIRRFMDEVRQTMYASLHERGLFERLIRDYDPAKLIIQSQKLYEKLIEVNCSSPPNKQ